MPSGAVYGCRRQALQQACVPPRHRVLMRVAVTRYAPPLNHVAPRVEPRDNAPMPPDTPVRAFYAAKMRHEQTY